MLKTTLSALLLCALAPCAFAQTTVIHAGNMIDVERSRTVKNQYIVIKDDKIVMVGSKAQMQAFDKTGEITHIDLSGMTVLPGLTDAHVHLTANAHAHGYGRLTESVARSAINGVANARKTLMAGFTTVRNVGANGYADIDLMYAIDDGTVPGPRMIPAGYSIGITGGHCDSNLLPYEYREKMGGVADGPWGVRAKVRQNVKYGAKVIKFCGTGGVLSKGTKVGAQQFSFEEMKALVDEAHLLGLKVTVHAHGADGISTAIRAGVDSVEHASLISDAGIKAAKKRGTYLSMDIYVSDYILNGGEAAGMLQESLDKERIVGKTQRERFQVAHKAGVKMAFGTDSGVYPQGDGGKQFAYMVKWGMTEMQAIRASTVSNADLFGLSSEIGSIRVGKSADIIAVDGNPLQNIKELEDVDFVMKSGVVYKTDH